MGGGRPLPAGDTRFAAGAMIVGGRPGKTKRCSMSRNTHRTRRAFLSIGAVAGAELLFAKHAGGEDEAKIAKGAPSGEAGGIEVSPAEDLMREHGVLRRVLMIYDESDRRLDAGQEMPPQDLLDCTGIIRRFIQDYHEKLEEDYLFPRFEKTKVLVDLVAVLRVQHQVGRRVTDAIRQQAGASALKDAADRAKLAASLRAFARMYRPHAAREDTVLFPALHRILTPKEYDVLGDQFEDKERALLGKEGFEGTVAQVEKIEKTMRLYDLAQFMPKV